MVVAQPDIFPLLPDAAPQVKAPVSLMSWRKFCPVHGVPKKVESVGEVIVGLPEKTRFPAVPVSSSIIAASSVDASMSFSMRILVTPHNVSTSVMVSMEVVETLLLKSDQFVEVRKPFADAEAAWPLV